MDKITEKAWEVFRSAFKDGEDVVVECHSGRFHYGSLKIDFDRIVLTTPRGLKRVIPWDDIEFMAHDGFPVSKLMGMTVREAEERAKQSTDEIIHSMLDTKRRAADQQVSDVEPSTPVWRRRYVGGGCPFIAGPFQLTKVWNKRNTGPSFYYRDDCEVLEFQAADGALMHSYDTEHLFIPSELQNESKK